MIPRWLLSTLAALFCWGIWALLPKFIGASLTGQQSQALSTIGMLPVMLGLLLSKRIRGNPSPKRGALFALAAGALGCVGNVVYYEILKGGDKATTVVPLTALYPLITILLAVILLKEKLNLIQIAGILLALVAIYLFNIQNAQGFFNRWLLIILIPVLAWGLAGLLQKISTNSISGELSTLWFLAASIPAGIFLFLREPVTDSPGAKVHMLVTLLGFSFALGNWAILDAFASGGKASIITPISGLYSMVSIPLAMIFLGERIGARETIAIAIALAAVAAISIESKPPAPQPIQA